MEKNLKSQIWKEKFCLCEVVFFFLAPVKHVTLGTEGVLPVECPFTTASCL